MIFTFEFKTLRKAPIVPCPYLHFYYQYILQKHILYKKSKIYFWISITYTLETKGRIKTVNI